MAAPLAMLAKHVAKRLATDTAKKVTRTSAQKGGPGPWIVLALVVLLLAGVTVLAAGVALLTAISGAGGAAIGAASSCGSGDSAGSAGGSSRTTPTVASVAGIPDVALHAYQDAASAVGLDWTDLAALAQVWSNHGSSEVPGADGGIGPAADGTTGWIKGPATLPDTDGGAYDGSATADLRFGAFGFSTSDYRSYGGPDGNPVTASPTATRNIRDDALSAAYILAAEGAAGDYAHALAAWWGTSTATVTDVLTAQTAITAAAAASPTVAAASQQTSGSYVFPLPAGQYTVGSPFHDPTRSKHNGQDYPAAAGTPIVAIAAGTVTVAGDTHNGFGYHVRIDHGGGTVAVYAHMNAPPAVKTGDTVRAGQYLGGVGNTGDSSGNHLHLEIIRNGTWVDPTQVLAGAAPSTVTSADGAASGSECPTLTLPNGGANGAWGGFSNGRIPADKLCKMTDLWATQGSAGIPAIPTGNHMLRCDAAAAFVQLYKAWYRALGTTGAQFTITDSYRSYEAQVSCRARKGNLCADPGTSNHGWGLAVDFGGGVQSGSGATFTWLTQHATEFDWVHPAWAQAGGSKPEAWHWEYTAPPVGGGDGNPATGDYQTYARNKVGSDAQFSCLDQVWTPESNWNPNAQNPRSTAFGIAQFLDSTWAGTGIAKTADPYRQIDAGLIYITNRYSTPCGALAFRVSHGWY